VGGSLTPGMDKGGACTLTEVPKKDSGRTAISKAEVAILSKQDGFGNYLLQVD